VTGRALVNPPVTLGRSPWRALTRRRPRLGAGRRSRHGRGYRWRTRPASAVPVDLVAVPAGSHSAPASASCRHGGPLRINVSADMAPIRSLVVSVVERSRATLVAVQPLPARMTAPFPCWGNRSFPAPYAAVGLPSVECPTQPCAASGRTPGSDHPQDRWLKGSERRSERGGVGRVS
jgi:hypothetical protein